MFTEIFCFYHEILCCEYSLELPHQGDSNEYWYSTCYYFIDRKDTPTLSPFDSRTGAMIYSQWLELPMSRSNFYADKLQFKLAIPGSAARHAT